MNNWYKISSIENSKEFLDKVKLFKSFIESEMIPDDICPILEKLQAHKIKNGKKLHKTKIGECDNISICLVNGDYVKINKDMDFVEGGNYHKQKEYIPKNEVWIDFHLDENSIPYVLLHELTEQFLMGKGLTYDEAHNISNKFEKEERKKVL